MQLICLFTYPWSKVDTSKEFNELDNQVPPLRVNPAPIKQGSYKDSLNKIPFTHLISTEHLFL